MQLFILVILIAVLAHDQAAVEPLWPVHGPLMFFAAFAPFAVIALFKLAACAMTLRSLDRRPQRAPAALRRLDRFFNIARSLTVAVFLTNLYVFGWLVWLRETLGEWIVINELIALTPPLATIVLGWAAYYPIDRRLREASIMRQLDGSGPVWPIWSRGRYVWTQVRQQLLLFMAPMLLIMTWTQLVERWTAGIASEGIIDEALLFSGGFTVFLVSPLMIRRIWDTAPLPDSELRRRLMSLCRTYGVGIRGLLLWRTYGGMINGAVMGLFAPLRYILLTDGLIERMKDDHIEAVMAHELGHVYRHHMPWLAICALVSLTAISLPLDWLMIAVEQIKGEPLANATLTQAAGSAAMLACWIMLFGYLSRRFERQADVFALQHMARRMEDPHAPGLISAEAARTVGGALETIARLNHHPLERRSWRHGSIAWRVDYLRSLIGTPIDAAPIDRQMAVIRWGCVAAFALVMALDVVIKS